MKYSINEVGGAILASAFAFLYVAGTVHSCKKHKDDTTWEQSGPYAAYRGVEMFWHDDFADVNWDERIKDDISTECRLISYALDNESIDNITTQIQEFSKKISTYPIDKVMKIKHGAQVYIKWNLSIENDMNNWAEKLVNGENEKFTYSERTNNLHDTINNYYGLSRLVASSSGLDITLNKAMINLANDPQREEKWLVYKNSLSPKWKEAEISMFGTYEKFFKEKFTSQ